MLVEETSKVDKHYEVIIKVIIPAMIGVMIQLAVEIKKKGKKISLINTITGFIVGVGSCWLAKDVIQSYFHSDWQPIAFASLAIVSEKIVIYLMYEFNVDIFITALLEKTLEKFKNK